MMLFRVLSFAVFLLVGSSVAIALEPDQVFAKVSKSIVVVGAAEGGNDNLSQGSGVIIAPGEIVTNCHVVENAVVIAVARESYKSIAKLRFSDPDRDLCQLSVVDSEGFESAVPKIVEVSDLRIGEKVYAIGAPQSLELTISDGLISSIRHTGSGDFIQTTAPISPGSSGGGLFNAEGDLIGITTFIFKRGQNLNFAIPASWITELSGRRLDLIEWERQRLAEEQRRLAEEQRQRETEALRLAAIQRQREEEKRQEQEAIEQHKRKEAMALAEEFYSEDEKSRRERARQDEWEAKFPEEAARIRREREQSEKKRAVHAITITNWNTENDRIHQEELSRQRESGLRLLVEQFWARISAKVRSRFILPPNVTGNPEALYEVILLPGGDVLKATLKKSSGVPTYDAAVRRAIISAQPLPVPSDPNLFFDYFRHFDMKFRPKE